MNKLELGIFVTALTLAWSQPAHAAQAVIAFAVANPFVAAVLIIGGLYMMNKAMKNKGMRQAQRSLLVNKQSNNDPIPVVYGRKRIGGVRVYVNTSNGSGDTSGTEYLNIALAHCEGKTGQLKKLIFNDVIIWDHDDGGTYNGGSETAGYPLQGFRSTTPNYGSKVTATYHPGHPDQTTDSVLSASIGSDWSTNNRLRGITYTALKIQFDAEIFEGGIPTITAEFEGKAIQDVSAITEGDTTRTLAAGTNDQNPVDVLYDYLVDDIYGKGLERNNGSYEAGYDIDLASFQSARTYASTRYKINGHLDTDAHLFENLQELLDAFNGLLIYSNGKYRLKIRQDNETPVSGIVFDESNIVGDVKVTLQDIKKRLNTMQATYANKDLTPPTGDGYEGYNEDTLVVPENLTAGSFVTGQKYEIVSSGDTDFTTIGAANSNVGTVFTATGAGTGTGQAVNVTYLTADKNKVLEQRTESNLITDSTTLKALLNHQLDDSRYGTVIEFEAGHTVIQVEAGDIVNVTHPQLGYDNKQFRVLQLGITPDNTINIVAVEYIASIEI